MGNSGLIGEKAYKIDLSEKNKLGEGSFAEIYKIKRRSDNKECAAKIFKLPFKSMGSRD